MVSLISRYKCVSLLSRSKYILTWNGGEKEGGMVEEEEEEEGQNERKHVRQ